MAQWHAPFMTEVHMVCTRHAPQTYWEMELKAEQASGSCSLQGCSLTLHYGPVWMTTAIPELQHVFICKVWFHVINTLLLSCPLKIQFVYECICFKTNKQWMLGLEFAHCKVTHTKCVSLMCFLFTHVSTQLFHLNSFKGIISKRWN